MNKALWRVEATCLARDPATGKVDRLFARGRAVLAQGSWETEMRGIGLVAVTEPDREGETTAARTGSLTVHNPRCASGAPSVRRDLARP